MSRLLSYFGAVVVALVPAASAAGAEPSRALRVGMDPRAAPWSYVPGLESALVDFGKRPRLSAAELLRVEGLEVDVTRALARQLGQELELVPSAWQQNENALLRGDFDILLDAWTPRPSTPDGIVASEPYWDWGLVFVVRSGEARFARPTDLAEARLGYSPDPATERALRAMGIDRLAPHNSSAALFEALAAGSVDAAIDDSTYARWRIAHDPAFRIVGEPLNRLGYHIGLRRDDAALLQRVNAAIRELRGSGELDRIRLKWLGKP